MAMAARQYANVMQARAPDGRAGAEALEALGKGKEGQFTFLALGSYPSSNRTFIHNLE